MLDFKIPLLKQNSMIMTLKNVLLINAISSGITGFFLVLKPDVFADLFLAIDKGEITNVKAFLGTIAKRTAIDRFRSLAGRAKRTAVMDEDDMLGLASDFNVEQMSDNNELRRILLDQIEALGEPDSTILIEKFYYNKTSSEIAERVSMTASSVRSRCTRAMQRLRTSLSAVGITK